MAKPKLLLIDADYAPYAFGNHPDFDAPVRTQRWFNWIYDKLGTTKSINILSGSGNYRYEVAVTKPYKGTRKDKEKPPQYQAIKDFIIRKRNTLVAQGMEADDLIHILYHKYKDAYDVWIVADDKDFALITDSNQYRHTNNVQLTIKDEIKVKWESDGFDENDFPIYKSVRSYYGKFALLYQMLIGDNADNIPGVPGIGHNNIIFKTEFIEGITVKQATAIVWREYLKYYREEAVDKFLEQYLLLHLIAHNQNI